MEVDCGGALKRGEPAESLPLEIEGGMSLPQIAKSEPGDAAMEHQQFFPYHDDEGGPSFQDDLVVVKNDPKDLQLETDEGEKCDAKTSSSPSKVSMDTSGALVNLGICQNPNCQVEMRALRRQNEALKAEIKEKNVKIAKLEGSSAKATGSHDNCVMTQEEFQKLLEKRKEVSRIIKCEAEGRRLEGLRQIQDMKSRNGVHPFYYFPEEIWTFIMDKLPPADLASIYQIHDAFQSLLEPCRIQSILFPLSMDYKIPLIKNVCRGRGRRRGRLVSSPNELLRLRSVCKSFRDSVDAWIQEDIVTAMKTAKKKDSRSFRDTYLYVSDNENVLNKSLRGFSKGQKFVPRALKISLIEKELSYPDSISDSEDEETLSDLDERNEDDDLISRSSVSSLSDLDEDIAPPPPERDFREVFSSFKESVDEFLESVGDQVLRFEVDCRYLKILEHRGLSFTQIYIALRGWLLLMPNLKWISVKAASHTVPGFPSRTLRQMNVVDPSTLEIVEMPTLESLERVDLHVRSGTRADFSLCDAVLNANPQVKIHNFFGKLHLFERVTNAEVLKLSLETPPVGLEKHNLSLPFLEEISQSSWKLKRVAVQMSARNESLFEVFKSLQSFPHLEDLSLRLGHVTIGGHPKYLRLPNLKKFKVDFGLGILIKCEEAFSFIFFLQFLMHCEKLEYLLWNNDCLDKEVIRPKIDSMEGKNHAMIDFKGGLFDLSGSNVWDIFPRLGYIKVMFQESHREEGTQYFSSEYRNRKLVSSKQSRF